MHLMTHLHSLGVIVRTAEAGGETPSVLAVPVDELVVGLLAFFLVFGALAKFALPNIKRTLAARSDAIEGGLSRAEDAQREATATLDEYRQQLAGAREEAASIRTQAQSERSSIVEAARSEARAAAQQIADASEAQLAADRAQATAALTRQVGELAVALAAKVVGQSLQEDARVRKTVDDFLDDLERRAAR